MTIKKTREKSTFIDLWYNLKQIPPPGKPHHPEYRELSNELPRGSLKTFPNEDSRQTAFYYFKGLYEGWADARGTNQLQSVDFHSFPNYIKLFHQTHQPFFSIVIRIIKHIQAWENAENKRFKNLHSGTLVLYNVCFTSRRALSYKGKKISLISMGGWHVDTKQLPIGAL